MIGINISTWEIIIGGQNIVKRKWILFYNNICLDKFRLIDWSNLYEQTNPDNAILVDKIVDVIEVKQAPMGVT